MPDISLYALFSIKQYGVPEENAIAQVLFATLARDRLVNVQLISFLKNDERPHNPGSAD